MFQLGLICMSEVSGGKAPFPSHESKANNTANKLAVWILAAFSQPTCIIVSSSQLMYDPPVSLTDFFGSCAQAGCKLTARFSSLSSLLSSTSSFSRLTANYNTCSEETGRYMQIRAPIESQA